MSTDGGSDCLVLFSRVISVELFINQAFFLTKALFPAPGCMLSVLLSLVPSRRLFHLLDR